MNKLNGGIHRKSIGKFRSMKLSFDILRSISKANKGESFEESRKIAREETINFYNTIFKELGINVNINFSENAKENFPEELEALNDYILNGNENNPKLSHLFLGNHTKGATEAVGAYKILPLDTRIQLKNILKWLPGINAINPIVFYRNKVNKKHTRIRNSEIEKTLEKGKRVFIFPEGTRVEGKGVGEFNEKLYSAAYNKIKNDTTGKLNKIITLISTDTTEVFPNSIEKTLIGLGEVYSGNININIDFIDIDICKNIHDFNNKVHEIIGNNLSIKI